MISSATPGATAADPRGVGQVGEPSLDEETWIDAAAPVPDDLDLVTEVDGMMAAFAAERFVRIDTLRRRAVADGARSGGALASVVERSVRLELASALRITEAAAARLLNLAQALVHRYPDILESLHRARISERHAEIMVDALDAVAPDVRARLRGRASELAEQLPVGSFRRQLARLIETERSATLADRHESALRQRRVVVEVADDGMAWLHAFLPAVEAHAIHGRITAMAKALGARTDEERTLDQRRADVLGDLLVDGDTAAVAPQARGIRATVAITVPALALLDARAVDVHAGHSPAAVEGLGPIPLERARELCGGADGWMRVLTHPETGAVLSVGREQYRPPPALRRLVRWRADRCMAPGCGIPASRCEIDHTVAWEHGGETSLDNLAPLCKGHHTLKHNGGWQVEQISGSGGALQWTSPAGRRYVTEPERRVPVFCSSVNDSAAPF
ncbi:HNH endonuclease signature motif containing protein [Microbacterium atlanticum]|uniref:HNH endonuclease signature motif containing protein n=1 Tax=Microbacterium atlanticum TaxID=2782168 RepID=UPI001E5A230D|nr:HNH endonuclease signature motif containing protein [Microbacterium atlanticum]